MRPKPRTFDGDTSFVFLDPMSRYLLMVHRNGLRLSQRAHARRGAAPHRGSGPSPDAGPDAEDSRRRRRLRRRAHLQPGMLRSAGAVLQDEGAPHAAALAEAFLAEINGDAVRALDLLDTAIDGDELQQPPVRSIALVVRAQLLEAAGAHEAALDLLTVAVGLSQLRGNVQPFLGFSRLGAPLHPLLAQLAGHGSVDTDWLRTLLDLTVRRPALVEQYDAALLTEAERDLARDDIVRPVLTVRGA